MSKTTGLQSWEQSDFPILCSSCLGPNPAIRMTKEKFGQECKVCLKPFTVFRWCPGAGCRFRKTEICQMCSRLKNVCQSCIFDLEYGLPVGVRDSVMQINERVPQAEVNRDYYMALNANRIAKGEVSLIDYKRVDPTSKIILEELSSKLNNTRPEDPELESTLEPIRKRNLPPACSFYAKGACTRGEACPFRHELTTERPSSLKSYRERFFGQEDPLAQKLLEKLPEATISSQKPQDKSITAFFVSGIRDGLSDIDLRNYFGAYGDVRSVKINGASAIVNFVNRAAAEDAAEHCIGNINIHATSVRVMWAKVAQPKNKLESPSTSQKESLTDQPELDQQSHVITKPVGPPPPPKVIKRSK